MTFSIPEHLSSNLLLEIFLGILLVGVLCVFYLSLQLRSVRRLNRDLRLALEETSVAMGNVERIFDALTGSGVDLLEALEERIEAGHAVLEEISRQLLVLDSLRLHTASLPQEPPLGTPHPHQPPLPKKTIEEAPIEERNIPEPASKQAPPPSEEDALSVHHGHSLHHHTHPATEDPCDPPGIVSSSAPPDEGESSPLETFPPLFPSREKSIQAPEHSASSPSHHDQTEAPSSEESSIPISSSLPPPLSERPFVSTASQDLPTPPPESLQFADRLGKIASSRVFQRKKTFSPPPRS